MCLSISNSFDRILVDFTGNDLIFSGFTGLEGVVLFFCFSAKDIGWMYEMMFYP